MAQLVHRGSYKGEAAKLQSLQPVLPSHPLLALRTGVTAGIQRTGVNWHLFTTSSRKTHQVVLTEWARDNTIRVTHDGVRVTVGDMKRPQGSWQVVST